MSVELSAVYTITGPDATAAVFNDSTSGNFVGYLTDISGLDSPEVRESADNIVEGDGGVHGAFYYGRRPVTFEGMIAPDPSTTLNARIDQLFRATNAMRADATVTWTETGGVGRRLLVRRQQPLRITERRPKKFLIALVSADPRITSQTLYTLTAATSLSMPNGGNVGSLPAFTIASPSATVNLTNTSTGQTLTFTGLNGGGTVTIDFNTKTITQGGVSKYSAITFPSSVWWELRPGSNTVTCTNAAAPSWRDAWV